MVITIYIFIGRNAQNLKNSARISSSTLSLWELLWELIKANYTVGVSALSWGLILMTDESIWSSWILVDHLLRHSSTAAVMSREIQPGENSLTIRVSRITWESMVGFWRFTWWWWFFCFSCIKTKLFKSNRWGGCETTLSDIEDENGDNHVWRRCPCQLLLLQPKNKSKS